MLVGRRLSYSDADYPAFSLRDGSIAWTWHRPDGCRAEGFETVGAVHHRIIISMQCGAQARFVLLDSATGRQVAEHVVATTTADVVWLRVVTDPDRSLALLSGFHSVRPEEAVQLLDGESGQILPMPVRLGKLIGHGLGTGRESVEPFVLRDARTGEVRHPKTIGYCALDGVLLESMVLCVVRRDSSWITGFMDTGHADLTLTPLGTQQAAELPVDLGPRERSGSEHALELVAANGAVIVYSDIDGRGGSGNVVVGLQ